MTIKTLRGWGLVVHALPRGNASGESGTDGRGPAEHAGIQRGDVVVGLDGRLLRPSATADDVAAAVRSSPFPDAIFTLDRSLSQHALACARRGEYPVQSRTPTQVLLLPSGGACSPLSSPTESC